MKSFIEFYESEKISPVSQDISDEIKHFRRRDALYRSLGLVPALLEGRSIIEFGPGSGYNSIHTASYRPGRYLLVDGNRYAIDKITALFAEREIAANVEVIHSRIEGFEADSRFDVVMCEGALPFQPDPLGLLAAVARHVKPGGILIITCVDEISYLPECLRRFAARLCVRSIPQGEQQMKTLLPLLAPHLFTMKAMSRPHEDWIWDNIIQPLQGRRVMGMGEVIEALGVGFSVHGASPSIFTDWRWYKEIVGDPRQEFNESRLMQYWRSVHNFIDYRQDHSDGELSVNRALMACGKEAYQICLACEGVDPDRKALVAQMDMVVERIAELVDSYFPGTRESLEDYRIALGDCWSGRSEVRWGAFAPLFGRGQQYLSLMRH